MKKMAGLQISVVTDPKSKQAIEKQIARWDENLEKLYMEQYRLRCYMASLQGSELPNSKVLMQFIPIAHLNLVLIPSVWLFFSLASKYLELNSNLTLGIIVNVSMFRGFCLFLTNLTNYIVTKE
jgi:hypothetical protein